MKHNIILKCIFNILFSKKFPCKYIYLTFSYLLTINALWIIISLMENVQKKFHRWSIRSNLYEQILQICTWRIETLKTIFMWNNNEIYLLHFNTIILGRVHKHMLLVYYVWRIMWEILYEIPYINCFRLDIDYKITTDWFLCKFIMCMLDCV